jgi:hypothetical protein
MVKIFKVFFKWVFEVKVVVAKKKLKSGIFVYWVRTHWLGVMLIEKFNHMS